MTTLKNVIFLTTLLGFTLFTKANIIFVDKDATGNNNGNSWANAYPQLHEALANATAGDEIWVAEGIYRPVLNQHNLRSSTFELKNAVAILGGFNGTETQAQQRQPVVNLTVLSGKVSAPLNTSVYHVVTANGNIDSTAVLDGFTIRQGRADGSYLTQRKLSLIHI